mmetsp:Transcript_72875/g.115358  ORF Transcript_72875/g.115358 Transcript_72875/m.115358 type:complete len:197 (-) Transcript_72875:199-789(-)
MAYHTSYFYDESADGAYEEDDQAFEEFGAEGYSDMYTELEWPAARPPPCRSGATCQFLKFGTCRFFHSDEEWEAAHGYAEATATQPQPAASPKPVRAAPPAAPAQQWNVLINTTPTPAKAWVNKDTPEKPLSPRKKATEGRTSSRSPRRKVKSPSKKEKVKSPRRPVAVLTTASEILASKGGAADEEDIEPPPGVF